MRPVLLVSALLFAVAASPGTEQSPRTTTDTKEYCGTLAARVARTPAAAKEPSRSLAEEGVRLCGNGHVRTGIAKLRRALRAAQSVSAQTLD